MGDAMQVLKRGNSLAVRLPATVVDALGLKEGDQIEIQVAGKRSFDVTKAPGARELLARLRNFRGTLHAPPVSITDSIACQKRSGTRFYSFANFWRREAEYRNLPMKCDVRAGHPLWEK